MTVQERANKVFEDANITFSSGGMSMIRPFPYGSKTVYMINDEWLKVASDCHVKIAAVRNSAIENRCVDLFRF